MIDPKIGKISPIVRFDHIEKSYDGESLVVKDLNLDIAQGEFLTLLGPSGSGKTTCLMMLAGFETPTSGEIYLENKPIGSIPPHRRDIGFVFQNYALFPHMTISENIGYPLHVRKVPKKQIEEKVAKILEMIELPGFEGRRPAQLSGGQQQRIALARALVFEPKLVLMDEPLGALDKNLREQMQFEIKALHEKLNITVVYVTHDQSEALTMSNRIAIFNDGIIQQVSSPETLYEKPMSSFVAQFIGENNRISGEVIGIDGETCKVKVDGNVVTALKVKVRAIGDKTSMSLRPERVIVNPEVGSVENIFEGEVSESIYLGDHIRTQINVCGYRNFIIKSPNSASYKLRGKGQKLTIGWSSADCRALDVGIYNLN